MVRAETVRRQPNGWTSARTVAQCSPHVKRELKPEEHEEIVRAVDAGDRIKATSIYLSATEGNLTDAQNYVKKLTLEAEAAEPERSSKKTR
jgi:hypothetical protein